MNILMLVVMALLFAALTPGVFIWLPFGASRKVAALIHGIVFAVVWYILYRPLSQMLPVFEGMEDPKKGMEDPKKEIEDKKTK